MSRIFELYLDTSALAKLYVAEPESTDLADFLHRHRPPLPFTSLHELELTHALQRRQGEGDITVAQLNGIRRALERDLSDGILTRPPVEWPGAFARGIHLLQAHRGLRSLDSLHIGLALELGSQHFITYDSWQSQAAGAEGFCPLADRRLNDPAAGKRGRWNGGDGVWSLFVDYWLSRRGAEA